MGARGRQANTKLSMVQGDVIRLPKQKPPDHFCLTGEQKREWNLITAALPGDHFAMENLPLLAQYVRHIVSARKVSQLIAQMETSKACVVAEYRELLKLQSRESDELAKLATRMRFSQHSQYSKDRKRSVDAHGKPWEDEDQD